MGGRRIKFTSQLILSALCAAWIAVAYGYWRTNVPLLPTNTLDASDGHQFLGFNRDGLLALGRQGEASTEKPSLTTGPIRYWDPIRSQLAHEILTEGDRILKTQFGEWDLAAIEKEGRLSVVELPAGRVLFSRPSDGKTWTAEFSPDLRLVSFEAEHQVVICETDGGKVVHEESDEEYPLWMEFVGNELVSVSRNLAPPTSHGSALTSFWNSRSWVADERFAGRQVFNVSPDGRYAMTFPSNIDRANPDMEIFDLERNEAIPPPPKDFGGLFGMDFSNDGSELIRLTGTRWHVNVGRWRIADQKVIQPVLDPRDDGYGEISEDGRFVVFHPFQLSRFTGSPLPVAVADALDRVGIRISGLFGPLENAIVVAETATGQTFGVIDEHNADLPNGVSESTAVSPWGIVAYGSSQKGRHRIATRFFTVPPRRNWAWLVLWSTIPLLIVFGAMRFAGRQNQASTAVSPRQ